MWQKIKHKYDVHESRPRDPEACHIASFPNSSRNRMWYQGPKHLSRALMDSWGHAKEKGLQDLAPNGFAPWALKNFFEQINSQTGPK